MSRVTSQQDDLQIKVRTSGPKPKKVAKAAPAPKCSKKESPEKAGTKCHNAWQTFLKKSPDAALSALVKQTKNFSSKTVLRTMTEYAHSNEVDRSALATGLRQMAEPFIEAGECFSSYAYDFPKKGKPFLYTSLAERDVGYEYMPLIRASLRRENCSDVEVTQILNDVAHIGPRDTKQLLAWVAENRFNDTSKFARNFLQLAKLVPFSEDLREPITKAMLNLLPEAEESLDHKDRGLIDFSMGLVFSGLDKGEQRAFVESMARQRPHFRKMLFKMARF